MVHNINMVNRSQECIDKNYPIVENRKFETQIKIECYQPGILNFSDFTNLKKLYLEGSVYKDFYFEVNVSNNTKLTHFHARFSNIKKLTNDFKNCKDLE